MTKARDLADLGSGITSGDLADGSVTTAKITDANVTTAKIADANVTTAKIADANVTQAKLAAEAVNEAKLQVSNAPTNGYMLTAQSGDTGGLTWAAAPTSSTTYGDVGTYVNAYISFTGLIEGSTHAGSNLYPAGFLHSTDPTVSADNDALFYFTRGSTALTGTWRAMGRSNKVTSTTRARNTLFVRIS